MAKGAKGKRDKGKRRASEGVGTQRQTSQGGGGRIQEGTKCERCALEGIICEYETSGRSRACLGCRVSRVKCSQLRVKGGGTASVAERTKSGNVSRDDGKNREEVARVVAQGDESPEEVVNAIERWARAVAAAEEDETENWAMVRGEYATFREEFRKLGEDVTQGIKTLGAAMDEWLAEADEGENSSDDGLEMEMESMSGDVEMEHMDGMEDHEEDVAMAEGV